MKKRLDFKCPWCQLGLRLPFHYSIDNNARYKGEHRCETKDDQAWVTIEVSRDLR